LRINESIKNLIKKLNYERRQLAGGGGDAARFISPDMAIPSRLNIAGVYFISGDRAEIEGAAELLLLFASHTFFAIFYCVDCELIIPFLNY
jgi:hypothetical protein